MIYKGFYHFRCKLDGLPQDVQDGHKQIYTMSNKRAIAYDDEISLGADSPFY